MKLSTMMAAAVAAPVALACTILPAGAVDYRAEMEATAIDPCLIAAGRNRLSFDDRSDEEILRLVKLLNPEAAETLIGELMEAALPVVTGQKEEVRILYYLILRAQYIDSLVPEPGG